MFSFPWIIEWFIASKVGRYIAITVALVGFIFVAIWRIRAGAVSEEKMKQAISTLRFEDDARKTLIDIEDSIAGMSDDDRQQLREKLNRD